MDKDIKRQPAPIRLNLKTGTAYGAGVGIIFGGAFGNPGTGLVIGAAIGLVLGASVRQGSRS